MKRLTRSHRSLLALSPRENQILAKLSTKAQATVTDLHRITKIPRTTVHFLLTKLRQRHLVEKIQINNHWEWQVCPRTDISQQLLDIVGTFDTSKKLIGNIISPQISIKVFQGPEQLHEAHQIMLEAGEHRVLNIQGHHAVTESFKTIKRDSMVDLHENFRHRGIILEGIVGANSVAFLNSLSIPELESHLNRRVIPYVVPDHFVDFDVNILIIKDLVAFTNPSTTTATLITNKAIALAMTRLFSLMKSNAQKIDLNAHIRELIKRKQHRQEI